MKIIFDKEIGFCFGAKRALKMVEDNLPKLKKPIKMYGSLVHNEEVTKHFEKMGIKVIVDNLKKIKKGTLIISAHGVSPTIKNEFQRRPYLDLLDTTCPIVARVQKKAGLLERENKEVLIFGDTSHQETLGIKGAAKEKAIVFCSKEELLKLKSRKIKDMDCSSKQHKILRNLKRLKKLPKESFLKLRFLTLFARRV